MTCLCTHVLTTALHISPQYETTGAEAVHLRYALLGAAPLAEQRRLWQAAVADEAAANAEVALTTAREISELAGAARVWWLDAAPAHSAVERERQTRLQRALVEPLVRAALQQVLGTTPSPPARRHAQHGAFVSGAPPFPPSAMLAAAAGALRLSLGTTAATEDAFALRRLSQLRSAAWAAQMAPVAARLDEIASRSDSREASRTWRLWATLASKQGARGTTRRIPPAASALDGRRHLGAPSAPLLAHLAQPCRRRAEACGHGLHRLTRAHPSLLDRVARVGQLGGATVGGAAAHHARDQ